MADRSMDRVAPPDGRISGYIRWRGNRAGGANAAAGAGCSTGNISIPGYHRNRKDFVSIQAREIAQRIALERGGNELWKGAGHLFGFSVAGANKDLGRLQFVRHASVVLPGHSGSRSISASFGRQDMPWMETVVIESELLGGNRNLLQITDAFDAARLFFRSNQSR